jgi:hypothetical protein
MLWNNIGGKKKFNVLKSDDKKNTKLKFNENGFFFRGWLNLWRFSMKDLEYLGLLKCYDTRVKYSGNELWT